MLYDVFLLRHSDQKQLPNYSRSGVGGGVKPLVQKASDSPMGDLFQSGQRQRGYEEVFPMPEGPHLE